MQKQLTELQPLLVVASREVDDIMVTIERDTAEAAKVEKVSVLYNFSLIKISDGMSKRTMKEI